jgi:hypothetical protein
VGTTGRPERRWPRLLVTLAALITVLAAGAWIYPQMLFLLVFGYFWASSCVRLPVQTGLLFASITVAVGLAFYLSSPTEELTALVTRHDTQAWQYWVGTVAVPAIAWLARTAVYARAERVESLAARIDYDPSRQNVRGQRRRARRVRKGLPPREPRRQARP